MNFLFYYYSNIYISILSSQIIKNKNKFNNFQKYLFMYSTIQDKIFLIYIFSRDNIDLQLYKNICNVF